jgi:sugar phosphate isomerase/epimerase
MKLSCLPVSYFADILSRKKSVDEWACEAAEVGLDGIDLSVLFLESREPAYLRQMRQAIQAAGLSVAMLNTYPDFTHPDPDERAGQAARLGADIGAAAALGAEFVRVTAGQAHPSTGREQGIAWAVEGLTKALPYAAEHGVQLAFENHSKPGVWQYADFSHPTDIFLDIVAATEGTALGINFDTANPLAYGDDPLPLLEQVVHRVAIVHVADTRSRGTLHPIIIGTGLVPFATLFACLRQAGYDGWLSIEEASGAGRIGVEAAVGFVRRTWAAAVTKPSFSMAQDL